MEITIDELRDANVVSDMWRTANDSGVPAPDTEMMSEMYESLGLNGTFAVEKVERENQGAIVEYASKEPWSFLKRRILYNSISSAGLREQHEVTRTDSFAAYAFFRGIHATGIPDHSMSGAIVLVDYQDYANPKPIRVSLVMK